MNDFFAKDFSSLDGRASIASSGPSIPPLSTKSQTEHFPVQSKPKNRSRKKSIDITSEMDQEGSSDLKRKRKKSISKDSETTSTGARRGSFSVSSDYGGASPSAKRPRGRPPLATGTAPTFSQSSIRKLMTAPSSSQLSSTSIIPPTFPNSTSKGTTSNQNNATNEGEPVKIPRPTHKYVVSKVLSKLMVSDPISASDLTKLLPDCPKDMIHSVLEISQVLGMVIQSKAKEGFKPDYPAGTLVYSFINYVKCPNPVPLDRMEQDIADKIEKEKLSSMRMAELYVGYSITNSFLLSFLFLYLIGFE